MFTGAVEVSLSAKKFKAYVLLFDEYVLKWKNITSKYYNMPIGFNLSLPNSAPHTDLDSWIVKYVVADKEQRSYIDD